VTAIFPVLPTTLTATAPLHPPLDVLREVARHPALRGLVEPHPTERRWHRIETEQDVELWLISWPPGTATGWHDHGTARGAFATLQGTLTEDSWAGRAFRRRLGPGDARTFPSWHVHDVRNESDEHALSLHAYAPRLATMTRYRVEDGRLEVTGVETEGGW
jgi:mannose-6-phosphate isomerase-like protein (cupin superfamily)